MRMPNGLLICPATSPGVRRIPMPSVAPTITARPKPKPRTRRRPRVEARSGLESDKYHVDGTADIARGVAGAKGFEFDVAALPAIDDGLAVGSVFNLSSRQVHDERVRSVGMEAFASIHVHASAEHRDLRVLEQRDEAHSDKWR